MSVHGTLCNVRVFAPDFVQKIVASYRFPSARREQAKEMKLLASQINRSSLFMCFVGSKVDLNIVETQLIR
jgi:hypothetical protein